MWDAEFRKTLVAYYETLKERNRRLSLRGFAKKLEVSPGTMSEIMRNSNRWKLTSKRALLLLDKMEIPTAKKNQLKVLMGEVSQRKTRPMPPEHYDLLNNWLSYPVLMAFDPQDGLVWSRAELAARLGATEDQVQAVIDDLIQRKYLVQGEDGNFRPDAVWEIVSDAPTESLRKFHEGNLELAKRSLRSKNAPAGQEFSTLSFRGSQKKIDLVRQEIRSLQEKVAAMMDDGPSDDLYQISVALFPIDFRE